MLYKYKYIHNVYVTKDKLLLEYGKCKHEKLKEARKNATLKHLVRKLEGMLLTYIHASQ